MHVVYENVKSSSLAQPSSSISLVIRPAKHPIPVGQILFEANPPSHPNSDLLKHIVLLTQHLTCGIRECEVELDLTQASTLQDVPYNIRLQVDRLHLKLTHHLTYFVLSF
jgi:hypothetical protein